MFCNWDQRRVKQGALAEIQDLHLIQEVHSPTRGNALLDLVLATGDDLVRGLQVLDHLCDSDHRLLEFTNQHRVSRACSKAVALDFKRADLNKLRRLVGEALGFPRAGELSAQDEWSFLKETILRAQGVTIPTTSKWSRSAQKPPWLTKGVRECLIASREGKTAARPGQVTGWANKN